MRLFGHPVHPMLVAFPIALLGITPVWDVIAWRGLMADAAAAGYLCELAGLALGGLAVVPGVVDLIKIPQAEMSASKAALIHAGLALTMMSLFGIAFALRGVRAAAPDLTVIALEAAGAACLAVTGWFGGHLVFHHRLGVEAGAQGAGAAIGAEGAHRAK
jgi:uncharacterized membrane protein